MPLNRKWHFYLKFNYMKKLLIALGIIFTSIFTISCFSDDTKSVLKNDFASFPESVKMYFYVEKYSNEYHIPKNIAYAIPYYESGYRGPADTTYNPKNKISKSKAYGAMQLKRKTAEFIADTVVTKQDLLNNTELNVKLSYKLLDHLHKKYGNWKLAVGAYNTGKPVVNKYVNKVIKFRHEKIITKNGHLLAYAIK